MQARAGEAAGKPGGSQGRLARLYQYRDLVRLLIFQELRLKYRRSTLGFLWSLLNPLLSMAAIATVMHVLIRIPMKSYAVYLLSSLVPWGYFSGAVSRNTVSLIHREAILRRQPVPALVFPLSSCASDLINLALSMTVLLVIVGPLAGLEWSWALLSLPLGFVTLFVFTAGLSLALATVTVYLRDVEHMLAVGLQIWMYLTPILYPLTIPARPPLIPEQYHWLFQLNPMYHVLQLFVRPMYFGEFPGPGAIASALACALAALSLGLAVFWWKEDDVIFHL